MSSLFKRIWCNMFTKHPNKSLKLKIGDRLLTFDTLADFEFCLAARTEVPASKVSQLVSLPAGSLHREAVRIREAEKKFVNLLAKSLEVPDGLPVRVGELGEKVFSQDHEWRTIFAALINQEDSVGDFIKIALVKYVQYLGARQDVLKSLFADRLAHGEADDPDATLIANPAHKETVIFDLPADGEQRTDTSQFERLPKGETVAVRFLATGETLEIIFSKNRFQLKSGEVFSLTDSDGNAHALVSGKNIVGRDAGSDIAVDPSFRDVSRTHLVIEPFGTDKALLTDLSSHGTFVPILCLHSENP